MIKELRVQNYAIIDDIQLPFEKGLIILTGETGSGKSIIMGALGLVLGDRADSGVLFQQGKKCVVEADFVVPASGIIHDFLSTNGFCDEDDQSSVLLRREISATGKSRAFINDIPCSLLQLRTLATLLADLHRQFDTLELNRADFQEKILDAFAGNEQMLQQYSVLFSAWQKADFLVNELEELQSNSLKDADFNRFLLEELTEFSVSENELEILEKELEILNHLEEIKSGLTQVVDMLDGGENPLPQVVKQASQKLDQSSRHYPELGEFSSRLRSCQAELLDISTELSRMNDKLELDQTRINWINERLSSGYRLQKKHGVSNTAGLLEVQNALSKKAAETDNIESTLAEALAHAEHTKREAAALAEKLEQRRLAFAGPIAITCKQLLVEIGMPRATFRVEVSSSEKLNATGKNTVTFLFDANGNDRFEPLEKVASGGELSRLMLCIKSIVAEKLDMPTLIFDEIDTGISGEAAKRTASLLQKLGRTRQVIVITHQPQIAAKADAHFLIYKKEHQDKIFTTVRQLSRQERLETLAKMMSGDEFTTAALQQAGELMNLSHRK
jgi:DNA repair protein RecN (Recombination protein N)